MEDKAVRTWTLTKQSDGVRGMRGHEKQYLVVITEAQHFTAYVKRFKVSIYWGKAELPRHELQTKTVKNYYMSLTEAKMVANDLVDKKMDTGYNLVDINIRDLQYA
jgi:hypothetical protein